MTSPMNPKVDFYFNDAQKWAEEVMELRRIVLECGLNEELKWGVPGYTFEKRNIVLIHDFKDYCAVLFFKGALLTDPKGILIQQTANVQAARQIRFTRVQDVVALEASLTAYIYEAIEVEKSGVKVAFKKATEFAVSEEFQKKLDESVALKTAFAALTPGRQKAYLLHFSSPKQSKTREARVEKWITQILEGKGLDD